MNRDGMNDMQPMAVLEARLLPVVRGRRVLIKECSFQLHAGRYLELAGPNGSGKTTLLRTLAGLQTPGLDQMIAPSDATVFYFGHLSGFRPELQVAEQLALSLQLAGAPASQDETCRILARIDLTKQAGLQIRQLSQGQVRRLMLGVMSGSRRDLWLIDEPFNALDKEATQLFKNMMQQHLARGGAAIVATHRCVHEEVPELAAFSAGRLDLSGGMAVWRQPPEAVHGMQPFASLESVPAPCSKTHRVLEGWPALQWVLRREYAIVAARPQDVVWPSVFHWMVVSLFPFGLGTELLAQAAAGVFWVSALLTTLIGAGRLFEADFDHGALLQMKTAGLPMPALVAGKFIAGWVFIGLPVALASVPLGLQYGLSGLVLALLAGSLALGLATLSALACLYAALGLMARQAQIAMGLLAIPIFVPLLIFGAAAVTGAQSGVGTQAPLIVLAGMALVSALVIPFVTARVLILALE